jgi:O-antigen ligase
LLVCAAGVFLTYSRGAWISLAVALATGFGLRLVGAGTPRARIMTLLAVPVAVALLAFVLVRLTEVDAVRDMLEIRLGMQSYDSERFAIQRRSLELALRSPLGIGPGQTEWVVGRASHQTYVRGFVENGYLGGLALVALMFGSLLRASWVAISTREPRLQVAATVVAASLAGICVESLVIDTVHWRHMWLLLAMAWVPNQAASQGLGQGLGQGRASSTRRGS